jgi:FkbM family methyltransferase
MERASNWLGQFLLRLPEPLRFLRKVPVVGGVIHFLSYRILRADRKVWMQVEQGAGRGLWLELNPRTGQPYLHGDVEPIVQEILVNRLEPGMVFYDLGANVGFFTLIAARIVGEGGHVFSFEPDPEVAARLRRNIERNSFSNVTVVDAGLWSSSGKMKFVVADPASPDRGTGQFVRDDNTRGTPTPCVALDDFVADAQPPNGIKCDVEGAEIEALRGAEKLLRASQPWVLCETHSDANDRGARELLRDFGYGIESVDGNHILALPQASSQSAKA